jgi:hypothetical protein
LRLALHLVYSRGETDDAGGIDSEYKSSGVSSVVGGVRYAFAGFVGIGGRGGVDFGGETWQGPNWTMKLVIVLGAIAGRG